MNDLLKQQIQLEAEIEELRAEKDMVHQRIVATRKTLDNFIKQHGNVRIVHEKQVEWETKHIEFEKRRQTPDWQEWHRNFIKNKT